MIIPLLWVQATVDGWRYPYVADAGSIYDIPLSFDAFWTGASEYDISSDEVYCPCGATITWDGNVGSALRSIIEHCKSAGHPLPLISLEDLP